MLIDGERESVLNEATYLDDRVGCNVDEDGCGEWLCDARRRVQTAATILRLRRVVFEE